MEARTEKNGLVKTENQKLFTCRKLEKSRRTDVRRMRDSGRYERKELGALETLCGRLVRYLIVIVIIFFFFAERT